MRFLLVSDLHYALEQFDWTVKVASDFDAVIIAGDHLDIASRVDGNVQIVVILKYLKRLMERTQVIVSSGNHDLDMRDETGEKTARWMNRVRQIGIATDGDTVTAAGDTLVTVCSWWDGPNAKAAVQAQIARDAAKPKTSWVWVYHAPPADSPTSWTGKTFYGDRELIGWIEQYQPDIVLTGHIHQAPFTKDGSWADRIGSTWVFNCGKQPGPTPPYIVVDTDAHEAAWFSIAGAQTTRLDQPLQRPLQVLTELPAWLTPKRQDPGPSPA